MVGRSNGSDPPLVVNHIRVEQPINPDGQATLSVFPITYDYPKDSSGMAEDEGQLTDFLGQEYIIRRIVGNIYVANTSNYVGGTIPGQFRFIEDFTTACAGFFVARAADADNSVNGADNPIGMTGNTTNAADQMDDYSPLMVETIREPWMWRRAWPLGFQPTVHRLEGEYGVNTLNHVYTAAVFPDANWKYNQVNSGVSIDIKSRRHVRKDERLWIALANLCETGFDIDGSSGEGKLTWLYDLRIFGQLVKARARGAF